MLALAGVAVVGMQRVVQPVVQRYSEQRIAKACLIGLALGALATFFAPMLWLIYPIMLLRTMTSSSIFSTLGALTTNHVSPREQGVLMGVSTALGSLMSVLGPLWAGMVYDRLMPGAPYWMGAGILVVGALLLMQAPFLAIRSPEHMSVANVKRKT